MRKAYDYSVEESSDTKMKHHFRRCFSKILLTLYLIYVANIYLSSHLCKHIQFINTGFLCKYINSGRPQVLDIEPYIKCYELHFHTKIIMGMSLNLMIP